MCLPLPVARSLSLLWLLCARNLTVLTSLGLLFSCLRTFSIQSPPTNNTLAMAGPQTDHVDRDHTEEDMDSYSIVERLADAVRSECDVQARADGGAGLVKDLYEGPRKCQCCINWVDEAPADVDDDAPRTTRTKTRSSRSSSAAPS